MKRFRELPSDAVAGPFQVTRPPLRGHCPPMRKLILLLVFNVFTAHADPAVDVALVLATDVSGSISSSGPQNEYLMQKNGIVQALRDPEVGRILEQCNASGLAVTYFEWSGGDQGVKQVVGWRRMTSARELADFADEVAAVSQRSSNGETDVRNALSMSARLLDTAPFFAARKIISISSDGEHTGGGAQSDVQIFDWLDAAEQLRRERDRLLSQGLTIDALVIKNDPTSGHSQMPLDEYYRTFVVGGPGHIVVPILDFQQYAEGLIAKLKRELDNCAY